MTDELTSDLASISQLRVTSRGSAMQFKGSHRPATPEIARALDVDAIVEGSVTKSGDRVRITAQLIDARADRHLWGETFERKSSDVLALQADLASAVATAINVQLTPREQSRLASAPSITPEAHDAYLRGRYFFNRPGDENLRKAIAQFDEVVRLSPNFAPAYSGLSDAYAWAAYNEWFIRAGDAKPRVKQAAERAILLDSLSAEGHTSLGVYKGWFEYDWDGAEQELRRAIALNPNYAYAHDQLNQILGIVGRFDEATAEGERAMALDPLSPSIMTDLASTLIYAGKAAAARDLHQRAAALDPTFFFPAHEEGLLALQTGNFGEAIPNFERSRALAAPPFTTAFLAYSYGMSGDRTRAMAMLDELKKMSPGGEVAPFNLALVSLGLGDRAGALDHLEEAYKANSELLVWLKIDKIYDPLRSEPRFIALMKRLNFEK
jgi:Flp pilus assembly protein TadD